MRNSIIAEIGSVHDGSFGNAMKLIEVAAEAGADVVKFQTHIAEAETLRDAPMPSYFSGEPRFEYFERTGFTLDQWRELKAACAASGVAFLSSPFSLEAVDLLEEADVDLYKVPSGEVTNIPLMEKLATTGKPVILSSGMSDWGELDAAVSSLREGGELIVMQCTSAYPCTPAQVGLNVIGEMAERYKVQTGFSDHTNGFAAAVGAALMGADIIEKHLTFSRKMYGSDAANAMEPADFRRYVDAVREAWIMRENPVNKDDLTPFADMKRVFQKSIVAKADLPAGHVISVEDLAFKKPGDGISAADYQSVVGREVLRPLAKDEMIKELDIK